MKWGFNLIMTWPLWLEINSVHFHFWWSARALAWTPSSRDRTQAVGTNKFHIFTKQSILSPFSAPFLMLYTDVVNIVAGLKMASGRAQTVFPQLSEAHVNSYELSTVWPINSSDVKISGTAKSSSEKPKVSLSRGCYHSVWKSFKKSHWSKISPVFVSKMTQNGGRRVNRSVVKWDILMIFKLCGLWKYMYDPISITVIF